MFTGYIFHAISGLNGLEVVDLGYNSFNDTLYTSSLDTFTKITTLNLIRNDFNGTIPDSISSMTSLVSLDLSGNTNLIGSVPLTMTSMLSMSSLLLNDTHINGVFDLCELSHSLKFIDISTDSITCFLDCWSKANRSVDISFVHGNVSVCSSPTGQPSSQDWKSVV